MVEAAGTEAERILSEARTTGQEMIELARREARIEAEKIVQEATEVAESEKKTSLAFARTEIESQVQLDEDKKRQIVEGVVLCVCGLH